MRAAFGTLLIALLPVAVQAAGGTHAANDFVQNYCIDCHSDEDPVAGLSLESFDVTAPDGRVEDPNADEAASRPIDEWDPSGWEKIVKRLRTRQMPPVDPEDSPEEAAEFRPSEQEYNQAIAAIEGVLDLVAEQHPRPGRTDTLRRLNRTEYQNAIRDLLALDVDAASLLPADQEAHGFDNVTLGGLTPTLLARYLSAAEAIARRAVGGRERTPGGMTHSVAPDRTQQAHVEGLPLGTRGGAVFEHHFPQTGDYEVRVRLARDRDEHVEGLYQPHDIDLLLDRALVHRFTVHPVERKKGQSYEMIDHSMVDTHLLKRFRVEAGRHKIGVTFPRNGQSLSEIKRQPFDAAFNRHRHPRPEPAILEVSLTGPFDPHGPGDTESRRRVFARQPQDEADAEACAEESLRRLMRLAYRRPVTDDDLAMPMVFFRRGREAGGLGQTDFEAGMQLALTAVLVNPHFLIRTESDPVALGQRNNLDSGVYPVSDLELASRLSFFLWSSVPDDELLRVAESGRLHEPSVLREQTQRMLADERADSLVTNFAAQWLHLRNLESLRPDMRAFPDFDDNLREAMRRETELLFASVLRDDRSVLDLITTDTTYLNERLAKHYGVPGVVGSHFRPVVPPAEARRGGLLRHASVLAVTSYATRTAPTIRGAWVLEKLVGTPPPPPPPNVENLEEAAASANLSMRERLAMHRANPACASCHDLIDPIGFALENYDAVGRWRGLEGELPVDASGVLPDGRWVAGVEQLEEAIAGRPDVFATAMAEKLLTYALGRGAEATDAPAIRKAIRQAADNNYRFSSLIEGLVLSKPFLMREAP